MIYSALNTISEKLNTHFSNRFSLSEDKMLLSNIVNQDGTVAITETDKVILTLVNLQPEPISGSAQVASGGAYTNRPVNLNLFVLFSAHFSENNYSEALKFLSAIISYFQVNPAFSRENTPELDPYIEKLTFEIYDTNFQSLSYIWGMLGGKYLPSVVYKIRMVTFHEDVITGNISDLSGLGSNVI